MTKQPTTTRKTKSYAKARVDNLTTALMHVERKDLANMLGVHPNTIRGWENTGHMPLGASNHCAMIAAHAASPTAGAGEHAIVVAKVSGHDTISTVRAILEKFSPNVYTINC